MKNKWILLTGIVFLFVVFFSSCKLECDSQQCNCKAFTIFTLKYNFDTTTTNHFPIDEMENFKYILMYKDKKDSIKTQSYQPKLWKYEREMYKTLNLERRTEDYVNDTVTYRGVICYIINENLNYKDSITNIRYEHVSTESCNEKDKHNYCGAYDCMIFDKKSISFEFNGKKYSYSDSPITINYEKK